MDVASEQLPKIQCIVPNESDNQYGTKIVPSTYKRNYYELFFHYFRLQNRRLGEDTDKITIHEILPRSAEKHLGPKYRTTVPSVHTPMCCAYAKSCQPTEKGIAVKTISIIWHQGNVFPLLLLLF